MRRRTSWHLCGTSLAALISAVLLLGTAVAPAARASGPLPDSPTIALTGTPLPPAAPTSSEPVLVYRKEVDRGAALGMVDAARTVRTRRLPQGAEIRHLSAATSPDGRWLALCNGSAAVQRGQARQITLTLLDLTSGQVRRVTPLLSADFPANFGQAAAALAGEDTGLPDGPEAAALLQDAFWQGMCSAAWSPDGRYLAFTGQMDGPSSDLYLYDSQSGAIRHLSDDLEQTQAMIWSPDGRWILHSTAYRVGEGSPVRTSAVAVDGSAVRKLSEGVITFRGWVDPSSYLQWDVTGNRLQQVEIVTGQVTTLWSGTIVSWAVDPVYGRLAIVGSEEAGRAGPNALFVLDLTSGQALKVTEAALGVKYLGAGYYRRFIASIVEEDAVKHYFVTAEGALEETWFAAHWVEPSPDLRYVLVLGDTLAVYQWGNNPVREITLAHPAQEIERLMWQPGSLSVFFTHAGTLYALDLLAGHARPIDRAAGRLQEMDYAFARPPAIGPEAVWDTPRGSEFADCHFESESPVGCVADVMRTAGASPQALEFTRLLNAGAFMESFEEHGTVDVARLMFLPRPSDMFQYVLLNGTPRLVFVADDVGKIDLSGDPDYPRLARKYPELTIWESLNGMEGSELLPGGGQRFIVRYDLVDGCHVCRTGGSARVAFDFDHSGQFRGTRLLGLIE